MLFPCRIVYAFRLRRAGKHVQYVYFTLHMVQQKDDVWLLAFMLVGTPVGAHALQRDLGHAPIMGHMACIDSTVVRVQMAATYIAKLFSVQCSVF